jgi:exonuclease SbcC
MIKRIELKNFMSHRHTVIEPAEGLTVLMGPNNCGKSAVMTALKILCYNEPSTYVLRHGEKECSVIVETKDGDVIEWSRKKNSCRYAVNGHVFDRLRTSVPEQVQAILKMPKVDLEANGDVIDIHFAEQKNPVFLLNESSKVIAGFFAASSDASRLIEMQKLHAQRARDAKNELERQMAEATRLTTEISHLQAVPELAIQWDHCEALEHKLAEGEALQFRLGSLIVSIQQRFEQLRVKRRRAEILQSLHAPPRQHNTDPLRKCTGELKAKTVDTTNLRLRRQVLENLPPQPIWPQPGPLKSLLTRIRKAQGDAESARRRDAVLRSLPQQPNFHGTERLSLLIRNCRREMETLNGLNLRLKELRDREQDLAWTIDQFVASNPLCPTCSAPLSKRQIIAQLSEPACE